MSDPSPREAKRGPPPFTPGDVQGVQMAVLSKLIVCLDESGALNAEALLAELAQYAAQMPPGMQAAQRWMLDSTHKMLETSRQRRRPQTPGKH